MRCLKGDKGLERIEGWLREEKGWFSWKQGVWGQKEGKGEEFLAWKSPFWRIKGSVTFK